LLTARRDSLYDGREIQSQFGGFPFGGLGGFAVGSGGLGIGGLRGGLIGGGGGGAASGSIGPLLILESVFGTGFTAQSIADAILVMEQNEGASGFQGGIVIVTRGIPTETGAAGALIFNTITGIFQILGANGSVQGSGRTPDEAAANLPPGTSLDTFGLDPAGGGGGPEPLPFPRRSDPLPPLPLSHLRRSPRPSVKTYSARSRRSSTFCNLVEQLQDSRPSPRPVSPLSRFYLVERSTSPSSWARRVIPPGYVVRAFQTRSNLPELNRSVASSRSFSRSEKRGKTRTSSAEHLSSSLPHGWN